jgi:6-phosphofructokinase 2
MNLTHPSDATAILTVTLNPALDLSTDVETVRSGTKLRCGPERFDAGGGGVNVSRAIAKLGGDSLPFIAIGGATGQMLKDLVGAERLNAAWFEIDGITRQSVMVYERSSGEQYRFVLPGPEWRPIQTEAALAALGRTLRGADKPIGYIVASGSLPPGVPPDFYHKINALMTDAGARLVLDTSGQALEAAVRGAIPPPYIWVMDQSEAEQAAGRAIADMDALEAVAQELHGRDLAQILVLSFSEGGAVALSGGETLRITPPKVKVRSKVGAGDSFVAGLTLKLARGAPLAEACAYAVAAAASAVTTPATELCDGPQTERYFDMIVNGKA